MEKSNKLVVANTGWADTIPKWLTEEVKAERLILGLGSMLKPDCPKVGDAEVCVYLYTASLTAPMYSEQNEVYIYLTAKLMKKNGKELLDFMAEKLEKGLVPDEERELGRLRDMIYSKRGGEIKHPVLDMMRMLKKDVEKDFKMRAETGQRTLEEVGGE